MSMQRDELIRFNFEKINAVGLVIVALGADKTTSKYR